MKRTNLIYLFTLIVLTPSFVFASQIQNKLASSDIQHASRPFEMYRSSLPNGLKIWCQPRSDAKSILLLLVFNVGARFEDESNSGISHFVEHVIFKGTERWNESDVRRSILRRGGKYNGHTDREKTWYHTQLPAHHIDFAMDWLSEIILRSTFEPDKVEKEREVIFQEKGGKGFWLIDGLKEILGLDKIKSKFEHFVFPDSSFLNETIGTDQSLQSIDRQALLSYYHRHYLPNNATLIMVGDIEPIRMFKLANNYFGKWSTGELPDKPETPDMPKGGLKNLILERNPDLSGQCELLIGTRSVGLNHKDYWPLIVLGQQIHTNLFEELRQKRGLIYSLDVKNESYTDAGYFLLSMSSDAKNKDTILEICKSNLDKIKAGNIDSNQLREAKEAFKGKLTLWLEDNLNRAEWLADWAITQDIDNSIIDYETHIALVSENDLKRVANTYFVPEHTFIGADLPIRNFSIFFWIFMVIVLLVIPLSIWELGLQKNSVKTQRSLNQQVITMQRKLIENLDELIKNLKQDSSI